MNKLKYQIGLILIGLLLLNVPVYAAGGSSEITETFIWIAVLLLLAKIAGFIEKLGQPPVLGELIMGMILGNLVLVGIPWFEHAKHNELLEFLAQLGVVILLFQVGLACSNQGIPIKTRLPKTMPMINSPNTGG